MATEPLRRSSLIRLAIVVEGETEEEFVKNILAKYLYSCGVISHAIMPRRRGITSGGGIPISQLASQMYKLCWNFDFVTSLFDLYGFPSRPSGESVEDLERRINEEVDELFGDDWDRSRVFAYVQKHEFEGLLFSDVGVFTHVPNVSQRSIQSLEDIRACFPTPEDIDDGPTTAPSKCILKLVPGYRKRLFGPILAEEAGLARIRAECPRFDSWVSRLESLGSPYPATDSVPETTSSRYRGRMWPGTSSQEP